VKVYKLSRALHRNNSTLKIMKYDKDKTDETKFSVIKVNVLTNSQLSD